MPNGSDRNWVRLLVAVESFRSKYGHWPPRIRLRPAILVYMRELFKPGSWQRITSKVAFVEDPSAGFLAEDDEGHQLDYFAEADLGASHSLHFEDARRWLGVSRADADDLGDD